MSAFSASNVTACAQAGVAIDDSYLGLLLDVRLGGPVGQRILKEICGDLGYRNTAKHGRLLEDHKSGSPAGSPKVRMAQRPLGEQETLAVQALADLGSLDKAAAALGKSRHTLFTQLKAAQRKLGAKGHTHLVAIGIRKGLIQ